MPLSVVLLSCANVASRSSLTVIDRFLFGQSKLGFLQLYFFTNALPLFLGLFILAFFEERGVFWVHFLTWPCVLLAISTHLVGMSFSYAFRHSEVRQVIIKAKMPELIFAFASFVPLLSNNMPLFALGLKTYVTIIATLIGLLFIWSERGAKVFLLFDRTGLCIIGSLLIQMICASFMSMPTKTLQEVVVLSVATLLWRCVFMIPLLYTNRISSRNKAPQPEEMACSPKDQFSKISGILFFRAILALMTQLTFTWCVLKGSPFLIWPIFNTTPLVASIASQLILKENPQRSEILALLCFFSGSTFTVFL